MVKQQRNEYKKQKRMSGLTEERFDIIMGYKKNYYNHLKCIRHRKYVNQHNLDTEHINILNRLLLRHSVIYSKSMYFGTFPKIFVVYTVYKPVSYTHLDVYKRQHHKY